MTTADGPFAERSTARLAVLMPVYNAELVLREALDSVLRQTLGDFELLAVDNASTDGSRRVLERAVRLDPRVRILTCAEPGIVNALNAGLVEVRSEFVARMDADDIAAPERFAVQLRHLRANPDLVALGCRCLVVDEDGDPLEIRGTLTEHESIEEGLLGGRVSYLCHSAMMFRSHAVTVVGGYRSDVGVSEDLDLYLRLAEIGRLGNAPELAMTIRRWPESTTRRQTSEQFAWSQRGSSTRPFVAGGSPTDATSTAGSGSSPTRHTRISTASRRRSSTASGARHASTPGGRSGARRAGSPHGRCWPAACWDWLLRDGAIAVPGTAPATRWH